MKTLLGMVTFGNVDFTKLAVESVLETSAITVDDMFLVVGKPGDVDTIEFLVSMQIPFTVHEQNYGFPFSINDIYDYAWKTKNYKNLIIQGNDVCPYPYAINQLIEIANTTENEWVCAREYDVKTLVRDHPETAKYFGGNSYIFTDFSSRPWKPYINPKNEIEMDSAGLSDVHNLTLFKRSVFEKIGYIDVNFYPAYYEDNDYCRRAVHAKIKSCTSMNSIYFHFWSRVIHQGTGGSNHKYFEANRRFYLTKWGGDFGGEAYNTPFNGQGYMLGYGIPLPNTINIQTRENEVDIVNYWTQ